MIRVLMLTVMLVGVASAQAQSSQYQPLLASVSSLVQTECPEELLSLNEVECFEANASAEVLRLSLDIAVLSSDATWLTTWQQDDGSATVMRGFAWRDAPHLFAVADAGRRSALLVMPADQD